MSVERFRPRHNHPIGMTRLSCDGYGPKPCIISTSLDGDDAKTVRHVAKRLGWLIERGQDLCPGCREQIFDIRRCEVCNLLIKWSHEGRMWLHNDLAWNPFAPNPHAALLKVDALATEDPS